MSNKGKHKLKLLSLLIPITILVSSLPTARTRQSTSKRQVVAPGIIHDHISDSEAPLSIHVLRVDLTNDRVYLQSYKAKNRVSGRETLSEMVSNVADSHIIAAVNGDIFEVEGRSLGLQVVKGEIVHMPSDDPVLAVIGEAKPYIGKIKFQGQVRGKSQLEISAVNRQRLENNLILYNNYWGASTQSNQWGLEFLIKPIETVQTNQSFKAIICDLDSLNGNTAILPNHCVLSGHGKMRTALLRVGSIGDTLQILLQLKPIVEPIVAAIGGLPRIVRKGRVSIEYNRSNRDNFVKTKHPRTAVGVNKKRNTLFIVVVDGRQPEYSIGMTLEELAEFMRELGAYDALNLDGGGSTTLWLKGRILNKPCNAEGERPVANALLIMKK